MLITARPLFLILALAGATPVLAGDWEDCTSTESELVIRGCSAVIDAGINTVVNRAIAYVNRGKAYVITDTGRAIKDYGNAIQLNPTSQEAYYNRGLAYWDQAQISPALRDFDRVIALNPKRIDAYVSRGEIYTYTKQHDLALADFNKAIAIDPKYGRAYYRRAIEFEKRNDLKHAMEDLRTAISNVSGDKTTVAKAKDRLEQIETGIKQDITNAAEEKAKLAEEKAKLAEVRARHVFVEAEIARQKQANPKALPLKSELTIGTEGSKLVFYDAACDGPAECEVAAIGCDSRGILEANLGGFAREDIAVWFASSNGTAIIFTDALWFEFQVYNIGFSDMDGDWTITIFGNGQWPSEHQEIWSALGMAKTISLTIGKRVTVLPHAKDMDELVKACAAH